MHGVIMSELKNFVTDNYDKNTWNLLLRKAQLWPRLYVPVADYPDSEAISLVTKASEMTQTAPTKILESFGEFVVGGLLRMYRPLIRDNWRTLDLIENTETAIHTAIRLRDKRAKPPNLRCVRVSPSEVIVHYGSERKMCSVARGIARGVANHYGDTVTITERTCMHRGDDHCEISVKVEGYIPEKPKAPVSQQATMAREPLPPAGRVPAANQRGQADVEPAAPAKKKGFWARLFGRT